MTVVPLLLSHCHESLVCFQNIKNIHECRKVVDLLNMPMPSMKASIVYGRPLARPRVPGGNITSLG